MNNSNVQRSPKEAGKKRAGRQRRRSRLMFVRCTATQENGMNSILSHLFDLLEVNVRQHRKQANIEGMNRLRSTPLSLALFLSPFECR